jgi:hypothetical protein
MKKNRLKRAERNRYTGYILLNKRMIDNAVATAEICADPMNGCPGDFSQDNCRTQARLSSRIDALCTPKWFRRVADRLLETYEARQWRRGGILQ